MGTGKRGLIATAVTVVCAVTVLAAPGTAFASPGPDPHCERDVQRPAPEPRT